MSAKTCASEFPCLGAEFAQVTDLLLLAVRYHFCYHFAPLSQYQFFLVASLHRVALDGGPGPGCVAFVLSVQAGLGLR